MIAPGILIFGLAVALVGVWYYRRKSVQASAADKSGLKLDFNDPGQRGAAVFFMTFIVIFVLMSVVGSYRAYEYTDSVQFCGQLCHTVMNPELTVPTLAACTCCLCGMPRRLRSDLVRQIEVVRFIWPHGWKRRSRRWCRWWLRPSNS